MISLASIKAANHDHHKSSRKPHKRAIFRSNWIWIVVVVSSSRWRADSSDYRTIASILSRLSIAHKAPLDRTASEKRRQTYGQLAARGQWYRNNGASLWSVANVEPSSQQQPIRDPPLLGQPTYLHYLPADGIPLALITTYNCSEHAAALSNSTYPSPPRALS